VLITVPQHTEVVEMLVVLSIVILAGVLSVLARDTRDLDDTDRRGWWPGSR
jgi:hypothetical protein